MRSDTFADHFSQARQFYMSQTPVEQNHIVAALTFELSKVETILTSPDGGAALSQEAAAVAVAWVHDAFSHVKVIGFSNGSTPLLDKAGATNADNPADAGVVAIADDGSAFIGLANRGRVWDREPKVKKTF